MMKNNYSVTTIRPFVIFQSFEKSHRKMFLPLNMSDFNRQCLSKKLKNVFYMKYAVFVGVS